MKSFNQRVNYAEQAIIRREDSRAFDNCFEMYDGAFVVTALMRRAKSNEHLKSSIAYMFNNFENYDSIPWQKTARKYQDIPTHRLEIAARQEQQKCKLENHNFWEAHAGHEVFKQLSLL